MHILAKRKLWRYAVAIVFVLAAIVLLVKVWPIISPFLIAILLAYLINPPLKKMTALGIPIGVSLPVLYFYLFVGLYFILVITVPLILEQLRNLFAYLPEVFQSLTRSVTVIIINVIVNAGADIVRLVNRAAVIGFITSY